jgi:hypothetical protein
MIDIQRTIKAKHITGGDKMRNSVAKTAIKSLKDKPFSITNALNLAETRSKIKFPVVRENMITVKNKIPSSYQMVMFKSKNELKPLGEVKASRPFILHEDLMDWLCEEFDKLGIDFKLRVNSVQQKAFSLYQQYLFNFDVNTPDREGISPLVFVKNSFITGSAFELHFGTFRYTCTNGATHTEEISHIAANSKNWKSLRTNGLVGEFNKAFNLYGKISSFFSYLYDIPLSDKFEELFSPGLLPIGLRKHLLASLESSDDVTVNIDVPKKKVKSKSRYLKETDLANIKNTVSLTGDLSMWDIYNRFTNYTSTLLGSGSGILNANRHIDHAFSVIAGRKKKLKEGK